MSERPYLIRISSHKGGVGKTTIAVNLSTALQTLGKKVLIIDSDIANPSVGFHLGIDQVNIGYYEVMFGKARLQNAIVVHNPTGMHVLPGTIHARVSLPSAQSVRRVSALLKKQHYDFIIVDTPPGIFHYEVLNVYDEALIVATPEMPAVSSSLKLATTYSRSGLKHHLVVNRVANKRYELSIEEIEEVYGDKVLGVLPEDEIVPISISEHIPAYLLSKRADFSKSIRHIARLYAAQSGALEEVETEKEIVPRRGFWRRLFGI